MVYIYFLFYLFSNLFKVRLKWLGGAVDTEMEQGDSDNDTMALRESLSQLSDLLEKGEK